MSHLLSQFPSLSHRVTRSLMVVFVVLQVFSLDYSSAVSSEEPQGRLCGFMFAKPKGKIVQLITITINRNDVEFSNRSEWDKDQVLRARVIGIKVLEVPAEKFKPSSPE